jgi:hypothetical protein
VPGDDFDRLYRTVLRRARSVVLVIVFVGGFVLAGSVVVVRTRVVDGTFYTDPQFASLREDLLGDIRVDALSPAEKRILADNALCWAVPPSAVQAGTEATIHAIGAYVRGDTRRLDPRLNVRRILDNIDDNAVLEARSALAEATDKETGTAVDYRADVVSFSRQLEAGTVPGAIPVMRGPLDPAALNAVLDRVGHHVSPPVRDQVIATVNSGDQRDALITAASLLVAERAGRVSARLRDQTTAGGDIDLVAEIAQHTGQPESVMLG